MAIKDLYGVGKGAATIVDLRPIQEYTAANRLSNERKVAAKMAKKATKAAALNSMADKLKNEGWSRHNEYLQEKLNGINKYVMGEIGSGGENVFADSHEKQAELKGKIQDFISWNQWSKNLTTEANKQLARSQKSRKEIDVESLGEFNHWMNQSPEYQRTNPMPRIRDQNRNIVQVIKEDYSKSLSGMSKRDSYTGKPDETGRIVTSDIIQIDRGAYNTFIKNNLENSDSELNILSGEYALNKLEADNEIGKTIYTSQGEERNPEYLKEYNRLKESFMRSETEDFLPREDKLFKASFKPGAGTKEALSVTEVTEGERGYTSAEAPEKIRKSGLVSKSGTIGNKKVYQLSSPVFVDKVEGKIYTSKQEAIKAKIPDEDLKEIPIGTWVDNDYNRARNVKDIKETSVKKTHPVVREVTIQNSPTKKIRVSEILLPNGKKEVQEEGTVLEGKLVGYHKKKIMETSSKIIHEDDEGYNPKAKSAKTIEVATIKTKDGKVVEVRATDQVKSIFKKEFDKISEGEPKDITEAEYSQLKSGDTYTFKGATYTKE